MTKSYLFESFFRRKATKSSRLKVTVRALTNLKNLFRLIPRLYILIMSFSLIRSTHWQRCMEEWKAMNQVYKFFTCIDFTFIFLPYHWRDLCLWYCSVVGWFNPFLFYSDEMSDEQFQRKRELCEQVLKIFDKIMPGRSRKRGMCKSNE